MSTPIDQNDQFNTNYFPGGSDQDVPILSVHEVNPKWVEYTTDEKNRPTIGKIFFESFNEAIDVFKVEFGMNN